MTTQKKLIIAIDGPAGSGKSTVSKILAEKLDYFYVDTGAMYRAVAWKALREHIPLDDAAAMTQLAHEVRLQIRWDDHEFHISVEGEDVTVAIRTPEVSDASSRISTIPELRREMVVQQQRFGSEGGLVMEGRDIGTVVFPNADLKIFLDASPEARGIRRHEQDITTGKPGESKTTTEEMRQRDLRDASRSTSPMVAAPDAVHLDTTHLTIDQVVDKIISLVDQAQSS